MTSTTFVQHALLLSSLNAYTGGDIWQDVILDSDLYDEAATDLIDQGKSDMFATTFGRTIRWVQAAAVPAWELAD